MKKIKQILSVLIACIMCMCSFPVNAAGTSESLDSTVPLGRQWIIGEDLGTAVVVSPNMRANVGSSATITPGASHSYGGWSTHEYTIATETGSYLGFCAEPNSPVPNGVYSVSKMDHKIIEALVLTFVVPELNKFKTEFYQTGHAYAFCHAAIGYLYTGSTSGLGANTLQGIQNLVNSVTHLVNGTAGYAGSSDTELINKYLDMYELHVAYNDKQDIVWVEKVSNGTVQICKKSANPELTDNNSCYSLSDAEYTIYSDEACTNAVMTLRTDSNGNTSVHTIAAGNYWVKETVAPKGYALDTKKHPITVTAGSLTTLNVTDKPQLDPVGILLGKVDRETNANKPQGSASLQGAQYTVKYYDGLYDVDPATSGELPVRTWVFETNKNGFCYYGDNWLISGNPLFINSSGVPSLPIGTITIEETKAPEGYLINPEVFVIQITSEGMAENIETYNQPVIPEEIMKGNISVIKHTDDGSTQIETPEEGAEFEVFLKSAGSYEDAAETERDILVCDKYGYAITKDLPFGIYTVKQTKGRVGKELMPAFDVFVSEDGEVYRYLINNATIVSDIEIVKKDAETGKVISVSGTGFKVRNTDTGEYVTQHIKYPTPMDIEVYYTDSTGKLMLPEALSYGNYEIIEESAPYGYVLDQTPVAFKVDGKTDVVTVEKYNTAQKGTITVEKTGEVFSSAVEENGIWKPVYEVKGLEGAVYEVVAAEDVVTADGTVRYTKDQVVATVTTGKDGTATTKPLYLGTYEIRETKAPYGMVLNQEALAKKLSYAGQEVEITSASVSFADERQKAEISLTKTLEKDEAFGIGINGEILNVQFGLFATEDMKALDGTAIPKDGLLETAYCDQDGRITFTTDLPVGANVYVKEIVTDKHYILSDTIYPVTFAYAGQNESKVVIKVHNGEEIENKLIIGKLQITKKDAADGKLLSKAGFRIKDESGNVVAEGYTNENGVLEFILRYGKYTCEEFCAPDGYMLNTAGHVFNITEDGQIITVEMTNDLALTPKTGDEVKVALWVIFIAIAGTILYGYFWLLPKYENIEKRDKQNWRNKHEKKKRK